MCVCVYTYIYIYVYIPQEAASHKILSALMESGLGMATSQPRWRSAREWPVRRRRGHTHKHTTRTRSHIITRRTTPLAQQRSG